MKLSTILKAQRVAMPLSGDLDISEIKPLPDATQTHLSYAMSSKYADAIQATRAGAVFITEKLKNLLPESSIAIVVEDPELAMAYASRLFKKSFELPNSARNRIDLDACIFPGANLGSNVTVGKNSRIMPGVYLGDNVTVGDNTIIHPNCVIYHGCHIGSNCIIHASTVIGSDGFGYAHTKTGEHVKIEQMGNVIIEDDVEIGSNTSIDRAAFSSTLIKQGSKIDNLVHISHNVIIGERTIIAGQTGIAGSTVIGKNVVMAAQSGAVGHITIADFTTVAARGGVTKNTEPGKTYAGFPMMEHKMWLKLQATLSRLLK